MSIYFSAAKTAPSRYNRANRDGGLVYENVAIRGKGNTSLTQVEQYGNSRYSFKVEFDHYDNALNYYGLDKLSLNNLIQDNTMLKDYLCYQLMGSFGVDAPLCCFVYITVNSMCRKPMSLLILSWILRSIRLPSSQMMSFLSMQKMQSKKVISH